VFGQSAAVPTAFCAQTCGATKLAMPIIHHVAIAAIRLNMICHPNS
jgi:hypothetical protein